MPNTIGHQQRIPEVDVLRGFAMMLMFLVSSTSAFQQLRHSEWTGVHLADLVYPCFLFTVGLSMQLSLAQQLARGMSPLAMWKKTLYRSFRLFLLGILLLSLSYHTLRFNLGTLQCIALSSLLAFPFILRSPKQQISASVMIFAAFIICQQFIGAPGTSWEERWFEHKTFSEYLDRLVLGKSKGIEGVLSTLAVTPIIVIGALSGRLLQEKGETQLLWLGIALMAAGLGFAAIGIPLIPNLATPSFSLLASGLSLLCFTWLIIVYHRLGFQQPFQPLLIFGRNAIGAYVFVRLLQTLVFNSVQVLSDSRSISLREWLIELTTSYLGQAAGSLVFPLTKVLFGFVFCVILYRNKIFLKV